MSKYETKLSQIKKRNAIYKILIANHGHDAPHSLLEEWAIGLSKLTPSEAQAYFNRVERVIK